MSGLSWRVRTRRRLGAAIVATATATLGLIGVGRPPRKHRQSHPQRSAAVRGRCRSAGRCSENRRGVDTDREDQQRHASASTWQARSPVIRREPRSPRGPSVTAGAGDGVQAVTATASPDVNRRTSARARGFSAASLRPRQHRTRRHGGPVARAPTRRAGTTATSTITWTATDAGSGVASGPTPATDCADRQHRRGHQDRDGDRPARQRRHGSVTVKLDKTAPTITGSRTPAANANGWNNTDVTVGFTCSDSPSGIKSCSGPTTLSSSAANQSVTGTAVDNADNTATAPSAASTSTRSRRS